MCSLIPFLEENVLLQKERVNQEREGDESHFQHRTSKGNLWKVGKGNSLTSEGLESKETEEISHGDVTPCGIGWNVTNAKEDRETEICT